MKLKHLNHYFDMGRVEQCTIVFRRCLSNIS